MWRPSAVGGTDRASGGRERACVACRTSVGPRSLRTVTKKDVRKERNSGE